MAAVLVGGTEKLRGEARATGAARAESVEEAVERASPDLVVDLSDEPVLGPLERLALAGRVLALGIPYEGPDFRFDPPPSRRRGRADPRRSSAPVSGSGRPRSRGTWRGASRRRGASSSSRWGEAGRQSRKSSVAADGRGAARALARRPPRGLRPPRDGRRRRRDDGRLPALRRGLAGAVAVSNVLEGVSVAAGARPGPGVLDGSGAALPPVAAGRRVLVRRPRSRSSVAAGYLNTYRALIADLVVVTMAEEEPPTPSSRGALRAHVRPGAPVIRTVLRPRPARARRRRARRVLLHGAARVTHAGSQRTSRTRTGRVSRVSGQPRRSRPPARGARRAPTPTSSSSS